LWIFRNNGLIELKGDNQPVGQQHIPKPFAQQSFDLQKGDTLILSTDGFADQFGGEEGKKLKNKRFKELLQRSSDSDIDGIDHVIRKFFREWKADHEQVDDVLVIGIKV
jgi:serine phosphatase RsbU (regulator of sigma subunit)